MKLNSEIEERLGAFIYWGLILVTLLVTDRLGTDPVNVGKMVALTILTGSCGALMIGQFRNSVRELPLIYSVVGVFIFFCTVSIIFSTNPWETGFYGEYGRNTGLLTYIGLVGLFVVIIFLGSFRNIGRILNALVIAGYANILYAAYYLTGRDLFSWVNPYKKFLGTFGNPNFISSFMAIFITVIFARLIEKQSTIKVKIFRLIVIIVSFYVIKITGSLQGFVLAILGISLVIGFYIRLEIRKMKFFYSYVACFLAVTFFAILGILQKGPLVSVLYKPSVSLRGEYWHAGINMGIDKPFFGVGLDSYGTYYRQFRDFSAITNPGANTVTNAAHNVIIDIFAGTGLVGLASYVALLIIITSLGVKVMKNLKSYDPLFVALFSTWLAYQVQSIISINQIGLAVWGWALGGGIVAYSRISLSNQSEQRAQSNFRAKREKSRDLDTGLMPANKLISVILAFVISTLIAIPPFLSDYRQLKALQKQDLKSLISTAWSWPIDNTRLRSVAGVLLRSGDSQEFISFNLKAADKFPNSYYFQYYLYSVSRVDSAQRENYRKIIHDLDPYNPEFAPK